MKVDATQVIIGESAEAPLLGCAVLASALAGQLRARTLHLLSGAVIIEAVLQIDGLGDFLWRGTLKQDFGLVLATATGFAVVSAALLAFQGLLEIFVALHVRRSPAQVSIEEAA